MASEIVPFLFKHDEKQTPIRVVMIDGEPWFVAADVCRVLELENTTTTLTRLKPVQKGLNRIYTLGGFQMMNVISESGLYKLAMRSDKPQAEPFQDWIAEEVIPSIRRTGRYELVEPKQPDLLAAINNVQYEMRAGFAAINGRLDGARKGFSQATVRYVGEGNAKYENCECIYCHNVDVVTKYGEKLDTCHEHHVDGNKANKSPDNCTLPCIECHKRITHKNRPDHIPAHKATAVAIAFHLKLEQKVGQIKSPRATSGFWDFRVATQVEMDFPQTAKRRSM